MYSFLANPNKPIGSMYGIFAYIYHKNRPNVGKYTSPKDPMGSIQTAKVMPGGVGYPDKYLAGQPGPPGHVPTPQIHKGLIAGLIKGNQ